MHRSRALPRASPSSHGRPSSDDPPDRQFAAPVAPPVAQAVDDGVYFDMKSTTPVGGVFATVPRVPRTSSPTLAKATQLLRAIPTADRSAVAAQTGQEYAGQFSQLCHPVHVAWDRSAAGVDRHRFAADTLCGRWRALDAGWHPGHGTAAGCSARLLQVAGHRFELVYANRVHQPTQPRKERLRLRLDASLSLGGPSGTASPSPTDQTEPSPAEAAWSLATDSPHIGTAGNPD